MCIRDRATNAQLDAPTGVAVDAAGNLYIADQDNNRIRKVSPDGTITTVAGNGSAGFSGDGGPATDASLNRPLALAVDATGGLLIADSGNQRIRRVDTSGTITTIAGSGPAAIPGLSGDGGPATAAQLSFPSDMLVAPDGALYIVDRGNSRIRKVDASGTITTVAGTTAGFSGDGGPATDAQLFSPSSIARDRRGNLYLSLIHI